jgi:hypothetical protein
LQVIITFGSVECKNAFFLGAVVMVVEDEGVAVLVTADILGGDVHTGVVSKGVERGGDGVTGVEFVSVVSGITGVLSHDTWVWGVSGTVSDATDDVSTSPIVSSSSS